MLNTNFDIAISYIKFNVPFHPIAGRASVYEQHQWSLYAKVGSSFETAIALCWLYSLQPCSIYWHSLL